MNFLRAPLPLAIVVAGGLLTAVLWRVQSAAEERIVQRLLNEDLSEIAVQVEQEIQRAGDMARRQARRWTLLGGTPRAVWDSDAQTGIQLVRGVTGTAWVDASGHARWVANEQGVRDARDENAVDVPELTVAMERARATNDLVFSTPYRSPAGQKSICAFMPLQVNGAFDGYQVTWVGLNALLDELARSGSRAFTVALSSAAPTAPPPNVYMVTTRTLNAGNTPLTVSAFATSEYAKTHDPGLTEATLLLTATGTALCLILGIMATRLRGQRAELQHKNDELSAARAAISTQDLRYRNLFARSDLGLVVTDRHGTLLEVNDTFVRMTGYSRREDLEGKPVALITADKDKARLVHGLANVEKLGVINNDVWTYRRADGGEAIVVVNSVTEGEGENLRLICVVSDITKSVLAERTAAATKSFYDGMFTTTDIAIFDMDYSGVFELLEQLRSEGVTDLHAYAARHPSIVDECARRVRLNDMNQAALKLHGVRAVSDVSLPGLVAGDGAKYIFGIAEAIWNKQTRHHAEGEFPRAGGTVKLPVTLTLRVPSTVDEARRVPIMMFDRTHARAAANAREANVAKSRFLASMSHEIRTPLNGVIANLELLSQTNLDDSQVELIDDADKAATSLLALIGNILDFSKIEAGKLTVEMGEVQVDPLIREVVDILQSKARQKAIFIDASVAEDVPEVIRGDAARLRQILLNLIGNAVKFTERGGVHVTVRAVDWDNDVCLLEFSVHDSGPGFRPSEGAKLFEAFKQAPGSSARSGEQGTGLGLSICRSLVETFGGEMIAVGMPGEGASFRFTLPAECLKRATLRAPVNLTGRTILMIGSEALSSSWVASYFTERHAKLEWTTTMDEALNACLVAEEQDRHFDLAIIAALNDSKINREGVRMLRRHGAAPAVVSESSQQPSWRGFLRAGVAVVITERRNAAWLDRNIEALLGEGGRGRDAAAVRELAGNLPDFSGSHVLVLEDRLVNQTVIQRQLKRFNLSYALAPNGSVGLLELKRNQFDLVLADCSMPVMDGFEFTREVRRQEKEQGGKRHLPIVALTANAFREDSEKCYAAGMDDFLSKPITLDRLAAALGKWLKSKEPAATLEVAAPAPKAKPINGDPPIDVAVLAELLGEVDAIALSEIFREFAVAAHASYDDVAANVSREDFGGLAAAAHGAKGEARNAAAKRLGDLYAEIEAKAKAQSAEGTSELLNSAAQELARIDSFISEYAGRAA